MSNLLAIDPGPEKSAYVLFDCTAMRPVRWGWESNRDIRYSLDTLTTLKFGTERLLMEYPKPRGMPTSREEMDTLFEAGRIVEIWAGTPHHTVQPMPWSPVYRHDVKITLCGHASAKDSNIRQALIDRFGGDAKAIGGVKCRTCHGSGLRGRGKQRGPCPDCGGSKYESEPGPLFGISTHCWSALAVAVTYMERNGGAK